MLKELEQLQITFTDSIIKIVIAFHVQGLTDTGCVERRQIQITLNPISNGSRIKRLKIKSIKKTVFDSFNNSITMTSFLEQLFLCFKMICKPSRTNFKPHCVLLSILVGLHNISIFDSVVFILGIYLCMYPHPPLSNCKQNCFAVFTLMLSLMPGLG